MATFMLGWQHVKKLGYLLWVERNYLKFERRTHAHIWEEWIEDFLNAQRNAASKRHKSFIG